MTHLTFDGLIRAESDAAVIATLTRKGWQQLPPQSSPDAAWNGSAWVVQPVTLDAVRAERDGRLAASDWTQLPDAPVDRAAWATYRQALRDLPETWSGSGPVPWPVAPA